MADSSNKMRIRVRLSSHIKFIAQTDKRNMVSVLKDELIALIRKRYGIFLNDIYIRDNDGFEFLDEDSVGTVLQSNEIVWIDCFSSNKLFSSPENAIKNIQSNIANEAHREQADVLKQKEKRKVQGINQFKTTIVIPAVDNRKESAKTKADSSNSNLIKKTQPKGAALSQGIFTNEKGPTFEPNFKGFAVKKKEIDIVKREMLVSYSDFVPLKKKKEEIQYETI